MNELSMVFNKMEINTQAVLEAAGTKWNFLNFTPGLVGGHCIGVDPYYFTYKAEQLGYHSQIILAGRKINDNMGKHIANNIIKEMIKTGIDIQHAKVAIMGLTFKENVADVRNTKVIDIYKELLDYGVNLIVHDPLASSKEVKNEFGINLVNDADLKDLDCIVFAVPHEYYKKKYGLAKLTKLFGNKSSLLVDIKGVYSRIECMNNGISYWSL